MFSFLIGLAAGVTVILNGPAVRRGIAKAVLKGTDIAVEAGKGARQVTAKMVEDFEDALAEAKAEKAQAHGDAEAQGLSELAAQLHQIRTDVASLESKIGKAQ